MTTMTRVESGGGGKLVKSTFVDHLREFDSADFNFIAQEIHLPILIVVGHM